MIRAVLEAVPNRQETTVVAERQGCDRARSGHRRRVGARLAPEPVEAPDVREPILAADGEPTAVRAVGHRRQRCAAGRGDGKRTAATPCAGQITSAPRDRPAAVSVLPVWL